MKKLIIENGLLLTDLELTFKGQSLGLGLDFLQQIKAIINIDKLTIAFN